MKTQESDYVSFQRACVMLAEKLTATREEVALWAWLGKRCGGIAAYSSPRPSTCSNADGCDRFKPEHCGSFAPSPQYAHIPDDLEEHTAPWEWLTDAYFLRREVESFNPSQVGRYISWGELLARWEAYGLTENDVLSKVRGRIHDDELTDMAPIFGGTRIGSETGAPSSWAMFPRADVEAIEARDFPGTAGRAAKVGADGTAEETPVERQARLQECANEKRDAGVKAWMQKTADEEGISKSMLDRILRRSRASVKKKPGTIEGLKSIGKSNNR